MQPVPPPLPADLSLARPQTGWLAPPTACSRSTAADGDLLGVVTARTLAETMADGHHDSDPVQSLVEPPAPLRESQDVEDGIEALERSGCGAVPVLGTDGEEVVGWFDYRNAISTLGARAR